MPESLMAECPIQSHGAVVGPPTLRSAARSQPAGGVTVTVQLNEYGGAPRPGNTSPWAVALSAPMDPRLMDEGTVSAIPDAGSVTEMVPRHAPSRQIWLI